MYPNAPRVGRRKEYPVRITLPLEAGKPQEIDALLQTDEARVDFIRAAIEREILRRQRLAGKGARR